ncbi:transcriptional regulator [Serratia ureilytica]|uniref:transcriptional regulator n=1 Tax=Serratia ureilytica TaxID=300181 RepID=UPI00313CDA9F
MHNFSLEAYENDQCRVNALIGSVCAPAPNPPENVSRDRLLRVQKGLRHLLLQVIPQVTDEQQRQEIYLWVDGIFTITQCEECDESNEQGVCNG